MLKEVFPHLFRNLRTHFHEERSDLVVQLLRNMLLRERPDFEGLSPEERSDADRAAANLEERGYRGGCLRDALGFVLQHIELETETDDE